MILKKIWFADGRIYGLTDDGKTVFQSLLWYKRLRTATDEERNDYEIDDEGIHWYALDEDVSFESFGYDDPEPQGISRVFLMHPELNASAVARRLGISQSLMAQYISGMKKPSKERENLIITEIQKIGRELMAVPLQVTSQVYSYGYNSTEQLKLAESKTSYGSKSDNK